MNEPPFSSGRNHPTLMHSGPQKTAVPNNPKNGGSTPTPCLDKPVLAQDGRRGGGGYRHRRISAFRCLEGEGEGEKSYSYYFGWLVPSIFLVWAFRLP